MATQNSSETVCAVVKNAWHAISRMYNHVGNAEGLSTAVGFVLLRIPPEGIPVTHLGPQMGLEPRSLSRMLNNLESKGWIQRVPDPEDRRLVRLVLTHLGLAKRQHASQTVKSFHRFIEQKTSEQELQAFIKVTKLIAEQTRQFLESQNELEIKNNA